MIYSRYSFCFRRFETRRVKHHFFFPILPRQSRLCVIFHFIGKTALFPQSPETPCDCFVGFVYRIIHFENYLESISTSYGIRTELVIYAYAKTLYAEYANNYYTIPSLALHRLYASTDVWTVKSRRFIVIAIVTVRRMKHNQWFQLKKSDFKCAFIRKRHKQGPFKVTKLIQIRRRPYSESVRSFKYRLRYLCLTRFPRAKIKLPI